MGAGRPPKFKTNEELETAINAYFTIQAKTGKPLLVGSLCLHLDIDRKYLLEYEKKPEFSNTIKKAKEKIRVYAEECLFDKDKPTAGMIFNLKCNHGWREQQTEESPPVRLQIEVVDHKHED